MRINSFPKLAKKVKVCFKKWSYFYCRWATAYSRKMRKISNLLSLYLYEFSSCMNKTAQNAVDNFWTEVWWDLNLSQLVVSDIFFSTSISIWRVFSSSSIQYSMLDGTSFGTFLLPGLLVCLFVCLFVCLDAGPTSKLATNFRFRPSIYNLVISEIIEFKICLGMAELSEGLKIRGCQ